MKKAILKLDLHDDKEKRKAMKTVTMLSGIDSISMDMKEKKMTLIGTVDPVRVVSKLRKYWPTDMISVGPAKEPEKKEDPKKEEPKKDEPKKEEGKKEEEKKEGAAKDETKKEEGKKEESKKEEKKPAPQPMLPPYPFRPPPQFYPPMPPYHAPPVYGYNPQPMMQTYHSQPMMQTHHPQPSAHYYVQPSVEENPTGCVIV